MRIKKYQIAAVVVPIAISIVLGLTLTRYRFALDVVFRNSGIKPYLDKGYMKTLDFENQWHDSVNLGNVFSAPYIIFAHDALGNPVIVEQTGERALTSSESLTITWYNIGGGLVEHVTSPIVGILIYLAGRRNQQEKE